MQPVSSRYQTPRAAGSQNRINTSQELISPATHKHVSLVDPGLQMSVDLVHDDEAERKERRRSRVLDLQRCHLQSPATPTDRQISTSAAPLSGLTNAQLSEHYTNCIKLSTENKINSKNAFGLHLIDYMSEVVRKKEMTNFQIASSTLDASAKIYAGRVDAIHAETYKVLTGLARGAEKDNKATEGDEENIEDGADPDGPPGPKKRKKGKRKVVETNLKNINKKEQKLNTALETDPLFNKTSAAFDEGGTAGLLLNHLHCRDDMSELVLDSNIIMDDLNLTHLQQTEQMNSSAVKDLKKMFLGLRLDAAFICPEFTDFEFTNWSGGRDDGLSNMLRQMAQSSHAFDLDAEVETIPESTGSDSGDPLHDSPEDDFGSLEDDMDDDVASRLGDGDHAGILSRQSFTLPDNKEAQLVQNTINNIKHGTVGTLMQVLASEPSDYSYFNTNLLQTWAGPSHWKLRPKSKGGDLPGPAGPAGDATKKLRKKKGIFLNDYEEEIDFEKHFKEKRASTTLTRRTLDRYCKNPTTLPEDLHYEEEKLFKLFSKPRIMYRRQKRRSTVAIDAQIENYDYDNTNDKDNFCPAGDEGDDEHDDDDDDDHDDGEFQFSQMSQDIPDHEDGFGADLVAQPRKVAKIDIGFAKTAKKMDVKRLKASMWSMLTILEDPSSSITKSPEKLGEKDEEKSTEDSKEENQEEVKEKDETMETGTPTNSSSSEDNVEGPHSFSHMVTHLPEKVTKNMARNLSVPIAFVCLLHLANEKTLELKSTEDMDDLIINQG